MYDMLLTVSSLFHCCLINFDTETSVIRLTSFLIVKGDMENKETNDHDNPNDSTSKQENIPQLVEGNDAPGIPQLDGFTETGLKLSWTISNSNVDEVETYQVFFRKKSEKKWSNKKTEGDQNKIILDNLQDNTVYTFKVRACYNDKESAFSQESEEVETKRSDVQSLLASARMIREGTPSVFKLPVVESWKDKTAKSKGCEMGKL